MEQNVDQLKKNLRKKAKKELKNYFADEELGRQCSRTAADYFLNSEEYRKSSTIFAYMAMNDEVDLSEIMAKALADGKQVAVPRMVSGSSDMDFYFIHSLDEDFTTDNVYGIREPCEKCLKVQMCDVPSDSVFLVPGLAFNLEGDRLGRGKGFYDRYFQRIKEGCCMDGMIFCGVCTVNVITKAVPVDEHDFKMNYLLTEYGFKRLVK